MTSDLREQRCGRLDGHEPHDWTSAPLGADWPKATRRCNGRVVTAAAEQAWAEQADAAEAADDLRRTYEREATA